MTGSSAQFVEHVMEILEPIDSIQKGKFFGGVGLKCNAVQFAMLMDNALFLVVDDSTRDKYINKGMDCFWYMKKTGKVNVKKYHQVPDELFDDPKTLLEWTKEAINIANKMTKKK